MKLRGFIVILSGMLILSIAVSLGKIAFETRPEAQITMVDAPDQNGPFKPEWTRPKKMIEPFYGEDLALHKEIFASTSQKGGPAFYANDGDPTTLWKAEVEPSPNTITVDLGSIQNIKTIRLRLNPDEKSLERVQMISVLHSRDNEEYIPIVRPAQYVFDSALGNFVDILLHSVDTRYVRLEFANNTGETEAQLSSFEIYAPNLAFRKWITTDSHEDVYHVRSANDGNIRTYWEGAANTYPNILLIDMEQVTQIQSMTIRLDPRNIWEKRVQTFSVSGSLEGEEYSTIVPSSIHEFDPLTGNLVVLHFDRVETRYVKIEFTGNTAATGGQAAEIEIY